MRPFTDDTQPTTLNTILFQVTSAVINELKAEWKHNNHRISLALAQTTLKTTREEWTRPNLPWVFISIPLPSGWAASSQSISPLSRRSSRCGRVSHKAPVLPRLPLRRSPAPAPPETNRSETSPRTCCERGPPPLTHGIKRRRRRHRWRWCVCGEPIDREHT